MADKPELNEGVTIRDVEIFRVGKWNGDTYSEKDLDDMIEAYTAVGYRPPVKKGHEAGGAEPAFGWVENLRRQGDKLLADFANVPNELADAIKAKRFGSVSAEIFFNLTRNGKRFRRALKAVAVLGADVPGVADLKPLYEATFGEISFNKLVNASEYEEPEMSDKPQEPKAEDKPEVKVEPKGDDPKVVTLAEHEKSILEINALKEQLKAFKEESDAREEATRQRLIDAKVEKVIPAYRPHVRAFYDLATSDGAKVKKFTVGEGDDAKEISAEALADDMITRLSKVTDFLVTEHAMTGATPKTNQKSASDEVHEKVTALMAEDAELTYAQAETKVFAADGALKERYATEMN